MMTIRYMNGSTHDAVLLSRTETRLRVALQGSDDVLELNRIAGTWVTDDCEPVHVDFAWSRLCPVEPIAEPDCVCAHEMAAHLIHLLYTGDDEIPAAKEPTVNRMQLEMALRGVVS
jgi:hypothetical protein